MKPIPVGAIWVGKETRPEMSSVTIEIWKQTDTVWQARAVRKNGVFYVPNATSYRHALREIARRLHLPYETGMLPRMRRFE